MHKEELNKLRDQAVRRGKGNRRKAAAAVRHRKEEYLGARVPRELRERVIQRAGALGMPVSIFLRQILEQALDGPLAEARPGAEGQGPGGGRHDGGRFPHVLGWEEIRLNKSVACAVCRSPLQAGARVTLGLAGAGAEHVVLCQRCTI